MMKKWMLGVALLSTSLFSQASIISDINGADMAGISVTAYFADGSSDTQIWSALSPTDGGVVTSDWSLTLDGQTFGEYDDHGDTDPTTGTFYGLWELNNLLSSEPIVSITIDAAVAGVYFDIIEGYNPAAPVIGSGDHTPGSDVGMPFDSADGLTAVFSDLYSAPDLWGTLDVSGFSLGIDESTVFLTDTDKIPEPSTMFTFALGLIALAGLRKKTSGK